MIAAVVPAAGRSLRMGRPKLTLDVDGKPLIVRVVESLRGGGVECVVVVAPPRAAPGAVALIDAAGRAGAEVVILDAATVDMRATFERGLSRLEAMPGGAPNTVFLCPGDLADLTAEVVAALVARVREAPERIVVAMHQGRRGHPAALPWSVASAVRDLPPDQGVNALITRREAEVEGLESDAGVLRDLDTPEDYERLRDRRGRSESSARAE